MARWLETRGRAGESSKTRAALEEHLETCAECRALVIELARQTGDLAATATRDRERFATTPPLELGAQVGRYVVEGWLGAGGMGVVYRAHDPELDRQVALKVLRSTAADRVEDDSHVEVRARLLDEARAAARVSHPNVVTVYDAGTHDEQVYLAMELVSGQTLAQWAGDGAKGAAERRAPGAIVERFVLAARGLAAIHAAGLVHGDFKPQNVLLGEGDRDRVCVGDFGLARELAARSSNEAPVQIVGTLRYMAPEQLTGRPADAASDQYAFCVALREALGTRAPAAARRVLARGLAVDPGARFPSMDALLAELVPRRRLVALPTAMIVAVVACLVGGGLSLSYARRRAPPPDPCAEGDQPLAASWDGARRAAVAGAFAHGAAPYAADVGREVLARLDTYAHDLSAMSADSCRATRVRAAQSEELFDLRAACLAGRARSLGALSDELLTAGPDEQQKAVAAALALPPLNECADAVTLRARVPPSRDPAARAEAERVEHDVARAQTMLNLGTYGAAKALAASLLPRATSSGDHGLEGQAHLVLGRTDMALGLDAEAEGPLYDAVEAAETADDEVTKAAAWVALTQGLAAAEHKIAEAERAGRLARAALSRLPGETELHAQLEDALAAIDRAQARPREALARTQEGLALRLAAFGPDDVRVGFSLNVCAGNASELGDQAAAIDYGQRAVTLYRKVLGSQHPRLAIALFNLGLVESEMHSYVDAADHMSEAYAILLVTAGPDGPKAFFFEAGLAETMTRAGHADEALAHAQHAAALAERPSARPLLAVDAYNVLAMVYRYLGRYDASLAALRRASARLAALDDPPRQAGVTSLLYGETYLVMGRARAAVAPLERSLAQRRAAAANELDVAETKLLLARALRSSGGDERRAAVLDQEARAVYAHHPEAASDLELTRK